MNKIRRAKIILKILNKIYPKTPIPLKHRNKFTLLVSVLLSAQTTDVNVNNVTKNIYPKYNKPEHFVKLGRKKIENLIKSIGIFRIKAKSVYLLSKQLIEKHGGKVPDNFEDLEKLPGVGHKTASVVMSQGFRYPAFPVDTHIHRLAQRWGLTNGKNVVQTEKDLKRSEYRRQDEGLDLGAGDHVSTHSSPLQARTRSSKVMAPTSFSSSCSCPPCPISSVREPINSST